MDVPLVDINAGVMAKPSGTLRFFAGESSSRVKATTIISPLILPIFEPAPCVPTSGTGLMLTVLGGIAEFERELILQRTGDGRPRAKADGVKFGRKPKLTLHQQREALECIANGDTTREVTRTFNVDASTISRLATRHVSIEA